MLRTAVLLAALAVLTWTPLSAAETTAPAPANPAAAKPASAPAADALPNVEVPKFSGEQAKLDGWKAALDGIDASLHTRSINEETLDALRDRAIAVQGDARTLTAEITPRLEAATTRLKQLEPAKGAPAQSDAVRQERALVQAEVTGRQGILQQTQLITVRAQQALDSIAERRRTMFATSVLQRSQSLINPAFWVGVAGRVPAATGRMAALATDWGRVLAAQPAHAAAGIAIVLIALAGFFLSPGPRWLARWTARDPATADPGPLHKSAAAAAIVFADLAIPGITMLVLYQALAALGVLPSSVAPIVRAFFYGLTFVFFFVGLTMATLAPGRHSWRLIHIEDAAAEGLVPVAAAIALIAAAGVVLGALNRAIGAAPELVTASHGVVAIVLALLFMAALRVVVRAEGDDAANSHRSAWRLLIPIGWVAAVAAVLGPIAGFVALGRFAANEMLTVVTVLMSLVLLSGFADAAISSSFAPPAGRIGRFMRQTVGLRTSSIRQIAVILSGFVQLVLIMLAAFIILTTLGIQSTDVLGSMTSAFFGFKIGNFTISPSVILGALAVLVIGIALTRAVQRWLDGRYLPETSLDVGMRSSIRTGAGYIGVILALIAAFSFAGLSLQNIAIVAGALSVGIGFGLQSIVNNFVSGLILLVERPIKVGDRIEVGTRMGVVRRINVRATEIMTYDNVSVIVPNADLISGQVVNWMHGSFSARLSVTVRTAYDVDPDRVIAVLLDVVAGNDQALKIPEPFAIFTEFGTDGLEFMVFFYVGNISTDGGAANTVRLEILKRFREEGIDVPFAQRDLRLRDLDRLEGLVRGIARGQSPATPSSARSRRSRTSSDEDNGGTAGE